jgi:hypothetical protein
MESVNIDNLSPSLIDQTNHRTAETNLSPSYHNNNHHHQTDVIINNFKQTTTTESELINELNMQQQQQQTTPTKHISSYHTSSNKENLKKY